MNSSLHVMKLFVFVAAGISYTVNVACSRPTDLKGRICPDAT